MLMVRNALAKEIFTSLHMPTVLIDIVVVYADDKVLTSGLFISSLTP